MKPVQPDIRGKKLFVFGFGYTAEYLAETLSRYDWTIAGTTTDPEKRDRLRARGIDAHLFDSQHPLADPYKALAGTTHFLFSIPPTRNGDPVFRLHGDDIVNMAQPMWAGYLSTTGVYGNHNGEWVTEHTPPAPDSQRGSSRLLAEEQWQSLLPELPLHIFRLSGIYGPGRSALDTVNSGSIRRIDKPGHVFNRMHVEDIVQTLIASINKPKTGEIYNLADDMPASSADVIAFACELMDIPVPPLTPFNQAELAPIVGSFYKDNKRVSNTKIRTDLGVDLLFPDYRLGLAACMDAMQESNDLLT